MTDEQFVEWMEDFITVATQASPEDEKNLRDYLARQRSTRMRPRTGISGLSTGTYRVNSNLHQFVVSGTAGNSAASFTVAEAESRGQPLPEIQLNKDTGVKLVRSDDGGYSYRYFKQHLELGSRALDQKSRVSPKEVGPNTAARPGVTPMGDAVDSDSQNQLRALPMVM